MYFGKNSTLVDEVVQFTYPQRGILVITREDTDQEVQVRLRKARSTFRPTDKLWTSMIIGVTTPIQRSHYRYAVEAECHVDA